MRKRRIFKEVLDAEEIERIIKEYLLYTDDRLKDGSHELEMVEVDYDKKEREVSCKLVVVDLADLACAHLLAEIFSNINGTQYCLRKPCQHSCVIPIINWIEL